MNSPCDQCICVPICKNKPYDYLILECQIVKQFLYRRVRRLAGQGERFPYAGKPNYWDLLQIVVKDIRPTEWEVLMKDNKLGTEFGIKNKKIRYVKEGKVAYYHESYLSVPSGE
ncbi:MAG: hypothetical protein ACTSW1_07660 [Candidatus Hodarchaeales archaeon]